MCESGKIGHSSITEAHEAINRLKKRGGIYGSVYVCTICGKYHITSRRKKKMKVVGVRKFRG